jgi:sugar O-acyltransferase (sialic acid O-acetyltransferase NeuD family)
MKKKIAIYGCGGLGREVLALLHALPEWEVIGFYDDGKTKGTKVKDRLVLGGLTDLHRVVEPLHLVLAIGNPLTKMRLAVGLNEINNINFPTLIHPNAIVEDFQSVKIGRGSIVTAGVILTTDIEIGEHVLLNLNCTVGHDVHIGDCTSIMPGVNIAGEVKIGKGVFIGSGANILNGLQVGDQSLVGAGSVVTKSVANGKTVVGIPARPISTK